MSDPLLDEIIERLRQNESVHAAWLAGSRGRGDEDEFSDIDIWIAVDDATMQEIAHDPLTFVHNIVPTILHVNAPSIAPDGGAFLGSWVPVENAFVQVDWYLTPNSSALRAAGTKLLFGHVESRPEAPAPELPEDYLGKKVNDNLVNALLMISNMVKHARRGRIWRAADHARHADHCLINAQWFLERKSEPAFLTGQRSFLPEPVTRDIVDIQTLALVLLDETERIALRADMESGFASPIAVLRNVIGEWQESETLSADEFYRNLPRRRMAAGLLVTDDEDNVLLLETTYKQNWEIPGGVCEPGESPRRTAMREVKEELGLTMSPGRLLVFDHRSEPEPKGDAIMLIYDGGVLRDHSQPQPNPNEIAAHHFVSISEAHHHCADRMVIRLRAALKARREQGTIEMDDGAPVG